MFQYEVVGARGLDGQITVKRTTHAPLQLPSSDSQLQPSKKRPIQNRSGAEDEPSSKRRGCFFHLLLPFL